MATVRDSPYEFYSGVILLFFPSFNIKVVIVVCHFFCQFHLPKQLNILLSNLFWADGDIITSRFVFIICRRCTCLYALSIFNLAELSQTMPWINIIHFSVQNSKDVSERSIFQKISTSVQPFYLVVFTWECSSLSKLNKLFKIYVFNL